jgi:hypothetical protein
LRLRLGLHLRLLLCLRRRRLLRLALRGLRLRPLLLGHAVYFMFHSLSLQLD